MPFSYPFAVGNLTATGIALYLYTQAPNHGRPFLLVAGIVAAQQVLFETLGRVPVWAPMFASISYVNLSLLLALTGIASAGIAWHGWVAGARPRIPQIELATNRQLHM